MLTHAAESNTCPPSTSSAADSPARTFPMPAKELVLRESAAVCGPNSPGLLVSYDPASSSWRTSQRCLDGDFQEFWETWPRSGMTRNGIAYELPTLVPPTCEPEFGLLPTPTDVSKGGGSSRSGERIDETPTLQGMARKGNWPTPHGFGMDGHGNELSQAVKYRTEPGGPVRIGKLWPTPTAEDSQCKGNHPGAIDSLHAAVKLFPTPRTTGLDDGSNSRKAAKARDMWPTPTVQDAENDGGPSQFDRNTVPLNAMVKLWPTPRAGATGPHFARERDGRRHQGDDLATAVVKFATPQARDFRSPLGTSHGWDNPDRSRNLNDQIGGQLNPTWVEWLMGYPLGWTALEDSATPSSRRSRNGSGDAS